ncbi:unnamed protein product, partial [Effrenium voratum]
ADRTTLSVRSLEDGIGGFDFLLGSEASDHLTLSSDGQDSPSDANDSKLEEALVQEEAVFSSALHRAADTASISVSKSSASGVAAHVAEDKMMNVLNGLAQAPGTGSLPPRGTEDSALQGIAEIGWLFHQALWPRAIPSKRSYGLATSRQPASRRRRRPRKIGGLQSPGLEGLHRRASRDKRARQKVGHG